MRATASTPSARSRLASSSIHLVASVSAGPPLGGLYLKPPSSGGLWLGVTTIPSAWWAGRVRSLREGPEQLVDVDEAAGVGRLPGPLADGHVPVTPGSALWPARAAYPRLGSGYRASGRLRRVPALLGTGVRTAASRAARASAAAPSRGRSSAPVTNSTPVVCPCSL